MAKNREVRNIVVISDTHVGCQHAIMPIEGAATDGGGFHSPSDNQKALYRYWREFWDVWVPFNTKNEPFIVVHNGDAIDGSHHGATTQWSQNMADQRRAAVALLKPEISRAEAFYMIRGTEVHVGKSGVEEETLGEELGAEPDATGRYARWELMKLLGKHQIHFTHHIGTTSSSNHESSAVNAEISMMMANYARMGMIPPQVVVRSHRHRHIEVRIPTKDGYGCAFTTAAWQLKTPYVYRLPGGRTGFSQVGGSLIRLGDELHCRHYIVDVPTIVVENNTITKRLTAPAPVKALP